MTVAELLAAVERLAPPALAAEWDNLGLIVGRRARPVRRALVALELRRSVLDEARDGRFEAVVVHHPPIFPSLAALTDGGAGETVLAAAEAGVAVIAAHTNLDAAPGGLNDEMAGLLGLSATRPLQPSEADPGCGLGRVGRVAPSTVEALARTASAAFDGAPATCAGPSERAVQTVACCTGSGAGLIEAAREAGADAYVTCDLRYHDADRAGGLALVGLPHGVVEGIAMRRWSRRLAAELDGRGVETRFAAGTTDPWRSL